MCRIIDIAFITMRLLDIAVNALYCQNRVSENSHRQVSKLFRKLSVCLSKSKVHYSKM